MLFFLRNNGRAALVGAGIGLLYGVLSMLPELISGCFWNGQQGFCGLATLIFNMPTAFPLSLLLPTSGLWLLPVIVLCDALVFALVTWIVVVATKSLRWRTVLITNGALVVLYIAIPFIVQWILPA